jgi:hypothetical protein
MKHERSKNRYRPSCAEFSDIDLRHYLKPARLRRKGRGDPSKGAGSQ